MTTMAGVPTMEFHEVANLFPLIEGKEFDDLVEDVRVNGLQQPIWAYQGKIIDGRNRYRACMEACIEPRYQEWDGKGSLVAFSISLNIKRRHLTGSQLGVVALKAEELFAVEAAKNKREAGHFFGEGHSSQEVLPNLVKPLDPVHSAKEASKSLGVSKGYIIDAKKIQKDAPALLPYVMDGTLTIPDAKAIADLPAERQSIVVQEAVKKKKSIGRRASKAVKEAVKEEKAKVKKEERQTALVQTPVDSDHYQIYRCGVESLCEHVVTDSLDCIITDPPYPYEYIPLYVELSKFAQYALKPGGTLLVMAGQSYLPQVIHSLCTYMDYHWTLSYLTPGGQSAQLWQKKVNTFWKPLLWFTKGPYTGDWMGDVCKSGVNDNDKKHHHWGQSESGMADIIERFSMPGQIVCDPFVGGGTTAVVAAGLKRYFVGCDVDMACVQTSLQRVQEVLHERP